MTPNEKRLASLYRETKAKKDAGTITDAEAKAKTAELRALLETVSLERALVGSQFESGEKGNDVVSRFKSSGFDLKTNARVSLGTVGAKTFLADGADANVANVRLGGYGQDDRFAYTAFPSIGLGDALSVTGLVQTARTFAAVGDMDTTIGGSDQKPESTVTLSRTTTDSVMVAHLSEPISAQVFQQPSINSWLRSEMAYGLGLGIDAFVVAGITGAAGTLTRSQTTEVVLDVIAKAKADVAAQGNRADLLLIHPNDALAITLTRDANDAYLGFGNDGKVWGLKMVESVAITEGSPIVLDSQRYGELYFGAAQFAVNAFSTPTVDLFGTNRVIARFESPALVRVSNPLAVCEITLA